MRRKNGDDKRATNRVELARFEVLKYVHEGLSVTEISKTRKKQRSSIYKVLTTLIKKGFVVKIKRGAYRITEEGTKGLHSFVGLRYNLRQHNLHFKIEVLESTRNWHLKRQEIRQLPYFNKTLKLRNNEQDLFNYGNLQVKTTSKAVIIKMPTIYAKTWESAVIQAMQILEDSIYKVENAFKIRLIKAYKSNITIISNEYAKIQDAIAKLYRSEGNRIYLTGDDGKIWLITDFSFNTDELEFIHTDKATDDIDAIAPFFNDLRKNPTTLTDIRNHVGELQKVVQADLHNRVKHQKVLDSILEEFREFKKWREENEKSKSN